MIERIKLFVYTFCISFTVVMMADLVLEAAGIWEKIDSRNVLCIMLICFLVAVCQFFIGFIHFTSWIIAHASYALCEFAVVLGIGGGVMKVVSLDLQNIIIMLVILLVIYFLVFFLSYLEYFKKAQEINRIIEKKKKQK